MAHLIVPTISAIIVGVGGATTPIFAPFIAKLLQDNQEPSPEPEDEYQSVELKQDHRGSQTKTMTFVEDKHYMLYLYDSTWATEEDQPYQLMFIKENYSEWDLDVSVEKVVRNNAVLTENVDYWIDTTKHWKLCFHLDVGDDIEIYFKANETKDNMYAFLST